jgi:hypothetical protein
MFAHIEQSKVGAISHVVVYSFSRFSRDIERRGLSPAAASARDKAPKRHTGVGRLAIG